MTTPSAAAPSPTFLAGVQTPGSYPVLPEGMQRSQVRDLLLELRRALKLSQAAILTLLQIVERTRPSDWTSPDHEPVCFAAQTRLASELGKSERAVRYDEAKLSRLGLVEKRTLANGARTSHGGCGLVLSPLIARIPNLLALRDRLRAEWTAQRSMIARRSALYREVKVLLMEAQAISPDDEVVREATTTFLSWPVPAELRSMTAEMLADHVAEAKTLADMLVRRSGNSDSSGRSADDGRSYIQATNQPSSESCNGYEQKPAATDGTRKADVGLERLNPRSLRGAASEELQLYLDCETGPGRLPRMRDFTLAALRRLPELGISPSAWDEAIETMGPDAATLAVVLIDANRCHPVSPVRRPGGLLRAMARRHRAGQLNLVGSLIGLLERRRLE